MKNINKVIITGNLTHDPEQQSTPQGNIVLKFSVAVNDSVKQGDEWVDRPNYVDCVMFGKGARALSAHLRKGMKVAVEGKLRWSSWQDKQTGQNRSKLEVAVGEIEFMTPRDPQAQPVQQPQAAPQPYQTPQVNTYTQQAQQPLTGQYVQPQPVSAPDLSVYAEEIPF